MNHEALARRLAAILSDDLRDLCRVTILMTIRSQARLLPSYYAQFAGMETASGLYPAGFGNFIDFCLQSHGADDSRVFDFKRTHDIFSSAFPEAQILVVPVECFSESPEHPAVVDLASTLGQNAAALGDLLRGNRVRVRRHGADQNEYVARLPGNRLQELAWNATQSLFPKRRRSNEPLGPVAATARRLGRHLRRKERFAIDDQTIERIRGYYADENRALGALTGLDLGLYGYY